MKKNFLSSTIATLAVFGMLTGSAIAVEKSVDSNLLVKTLTEEIVIAPAPGTVLPFEDVEATTEFLDAIKFVYENGIMNGIETTKFAPQNTLTRAMLVTILYRSEGEPAFMNDLIFSDVTRGSYYEKAVIWAQGKGIVNGISATEFAPNTNVTREQLATILYRYANYKGIDIETATQNTNTLSFDDIMDISEYAGPAVHACLANGALLDNRESLKILPKLDATRAEAANAIMVIKSLPMHKDLIYNKLTGTYFDNYSQRAHMDVSLNEEKDSLEINVEWSNSAFENTKWTITAKFNEDDKLAYENCIEKVITYDEEGKESEKVIYENGKGFFSIDNGLLLWDGAAEEQCTNCVFEIAK